MLFGTSVLVFVVVRASPGDPVLLVYAAEAGGGLSRAEQQRLLSELGLDRPVYEQYGLWLTKVVHLDLGRSFRTGEPVASYVIQRLGRSLYLAAGATLLGCIVGIPMGALAAWRRNTLTDYIVRAFLITGLALPNFWLGELLVLALVRMFHWSPPLVYESFLAHPLGNLKMTGWPMLILGYALAAYVGRMARTSMVDILAEDYVRTARAKGLSERSVIAVHALKNSLIPIMTIAGVYFGVLVGGTVVMESVFNIPGLGRALVESVWQRDYAVIQGILLTIGVAVVVVNLLTDILYAYADPRIRYG